VPANVTPTQALAFASRATDTAATRAPAGATARARVRAVEMWVACFARAEIRAYDSRNRYLKWAANGPQCDNVYGLYELYDDAPSRCETAAQNARTLAPELEPLIVDVEKMMEHFPPMDEIVRDLNLYYDTKSYTRDDCAEGRAKHNKLMAAFDAFFGVAEPLRVELIQAQRDATRELLTAIETTGERNGEWHVRQVVGSAQYMMHALTRDQKMPDRNRRLLFEARLDTFDDDMALFVDWVRDNRQEVARLDIADVVGKLTDLQNVARTFVAAADAGTADEYTLRDVFSAWDGVLFSLGFSEMEIPSIDD